MTRFRVIAATVLAGVALLFYAMLDAAANASGGRWE